MDDWTDRSWLDSYDDPDLWSDPVRRWMMDWFSPVRGMEKCGKPFRGSGFTASTGTHLPALLLETGGFLLLETGGRLLLQ